MNTENLNTLIAALEKLPPEKFDMSNWFIDPKTRIGTIDERNELGVTTPDACGTAACIAGWCNVVRGASSWRGATEEGAWLGLPRDHELALFMPEDSGYSYKYPLARALDVLRHLRDTGEVDWDRFPASDYV